MGLYSDKIKPGAPMVKLRHVCFYCKGRQSLVKVPGNRWEERKALSKYVEILQRGFN